MERPFDSIVACTNNIKKKKKQFESILIVQSLRNTFGLELTISV